MKVRRAMCELATSNIGCCSDCLVSGLTMVTTLVIPACFIATLKDLTVFKMLCK